MSWLCGADSVFLGMHLDTGGGGGGALKLVSKTGSLSWAHNKCCHKPEQSS